MNNKIIKKIPFLQNKNKRTGWGEVVVQVVKHFPRTLKALGLIPSTTKNKKE
jgi:hypothetical protein